MSKNDFTFVFLIIPMEDFNIWMVRSGEGGYLLDEFFEKEIVAIGWNELGEISNDITYDELKHRIFQVYQDVSSGAAGQSAGQIWRFIKEFKVGDKIVTYDSESRLYYTGEIKSPAKYNDKLSYHHYRDVLWEEAGIDRDTLSTETKNTLGSARTIFSLTKEIWRELEVNHPGYMSDEELQEIEELEQEAEEQSLKQLKEETIARSFEFIKDIISKLSWQDTERLVSGLLRAMGYKTRLTSRGSDLGSDIIASVDELALDEPRIKVEVKKKSKDKVSSDELRSFIGGLRGHTKGIFVTTTGFSKDAKYEAERANFTITLIDLDWLVELLVDNYEKLDIETKALVPLKKIYWPV